MSKHVKFKNLFILSLLFTSFFFVFLSIENVSASSSDPSSTESIENENLPTKKKSSIQSEDSVYQETGGLYTEEDFQNAIPVEQTEDFSTSLTPSQEPQSKKIENKKQESAPPTPPIESNISTKAAVVPKTTGKLYFRKASSSGTYVCSASVINSDADNAVLTAGHCVHGNGSWNKDFVFVPAYFDGKRPYGSWTWERVQAPVGWTQNKDYSYDKAILRVRPLDGVEIEKKLGANGWITNTDQAQSDVRITGYPAESPYSGELPYSCYGSTYQYNATDAYMNCDFTGGASGGAWFDRMTSEDLGYIFAATSRRTTSGVPRLLATPLGDEFTNMIED